MCKPTTNIDPSGTSNLHLPVERDGKSTPSASTLAFLMAVALIPVWTLVVLPLTIVYNVGKAVIDPLLPKPEPPRIDSGYKVTESDIIPRPQRKYDVIVLGATGFTGRLAARHLAKTYGVGKEVKWAIAGRSAAKLEQVKKELAEELGQEAILEVDTFVVDTAISSTIPRLVRDTRAVITTVGPFGLYGSPVVEFCAKFGTHYVDITGETAFTKTMMLKWEKTAKQTGAKIISFCGHDSVPWDLTVMKLEQILKQKTGEDLVTVTCMDEIVSVPSGGTLLTISLAMDGKSMKAPETNPFLNAVSSTKFDFPLFVKKSKYLWNGETCYTEPFLMSSINAEVVGWSQALRGSPSLTYSECRVGPDWKTAFVNWMGLVAGMTALMNPITGSLLKKFVIPKPGEGPTMADMENKHFLCIAAEGIGSKGSRVESMLYFSKCPGYLETGRMVVESGLSLALEEAALPVKDGGFFTPSVGMGDVLLDRLTRTGTYFASRVKASD
jgi:short subunit dehydrogenase-like uncharacterized protein